MPARPVSDHPAPARPAPKKCGAVLFFPAHAARGRSRQNTGVQSLTGRVRVWADRSGPISFSRLVEGRPRRLFSLVDLYTRGSDGVPWFFPKVRESLRAPSVGPPRLLFALTGMADPYTIGPVNRVFLSARAVYATGPRMRSDHVCDGTAYAMGRMRVTV